MRRMLKALAVLGGHRAFRRPTAWPVRATPASASARSRSRAGATASLAAILAVWTLGAPPPAGAGEAVVEAVTATQQADGTWRFSATVRHADTGWDHYADAFTVHAPDGTLLGTRTLLHPHVEEQPFTRSLSGVVVPDGLDHVRVRAVDSVHGPGAFIDVPLER